ncbi:MAG: transposase, partial [Deltaproteobacteria bacterium]|nr:transposase [Deltaproteobacteria bacterium]
PDKRGKAKQTKARNLLERLSEHMDDVLRFTTAVIYPFTNKQAERALRMSKVKEKVSGYMVSFRTTFVCRRKKNNM